MPPYNLETPVQQQDFLHHQTYSQSVRYIRFMLVSRLCPSFSLLASSPVQVQIPTFSLLEKYNTMFISLHKQYYTTSISREVAANEREDSHYVSHII